MTVLKLNATKRVDLVVSYDGTEYRLSGIIPVSLTSELLNHPAPTNGDEQAMKDWENEVSRITFQFFLDEIMPDDFKKAIHPADLSPLVKAWMEHVKLGESPASGR